MQTHTCPKCQHSMEPGFVLDTAYGDSYFASPEWADGTPDVSFWTGVRMKGRERHPITTYRCSGCGYLEAYAGFVA